MGSLIDADVTELLDFCRSKNISKTYFATQGGKLICPHPALEEIRSFLESSPDYNQHEGVFLGFDWKNQSVYGAFVHRTIRGAGQGGTRFRNYPSIRQAMTDGIRLAEGMTFKNACADLWWGGGKGVIWTAHNPRESRGAERNEIFANYGLFVASLNGCYITAEDMNTNPEDMRVIHANNRFCTCIPSEIGGSSNPSRFTARGVFQGLMAGVHSLWGDEASLEGKHVLLQGAGNVGYPLLEELVENGAKVSVFDPSIKTQEKIRAEFDKEQVNLVESGEELMQMEADIFSPNAIGAILNEDSISKLKVKLVAGGANNQLKDSVKNAMDLTNRGILYAPDYIINCMGIINCANEQYGYLLSTIEEEIAKVYARTKEILKEAQENNESPETVAIATARRKSLVEHPIWGHRGADIIKQLIDENWESA